jgi:16S rRNA processing protein RimM
MAAAEDELLLIGVIVAPFGLQGQVKMRAITDHPEYIEAHVRTLYMGPHYTPRRLHDSFVHKPGLMVLRLADVTTREAAEALRKTEVYIQAQDAAPLDEGEYYLHDLYGLRVETPEGETLGHVHEVLETGANEVLVVQRADQPQLLLPMTHEVVQELDLTGGRVVVRLLAGLDRASEQASAPTERRSQ